MTKYRLSIAVEDGIDIDDFFLPKDKEERDEMIHVDDDEAFRVAAAKGNLKTIKRLVRLTTGEQQINKMLHAKNDEAFKLAAENRHLDIMEFLLQRTSDQNQRNQMIHNGFRYANHLNVMEYLVAKIPDEEQLNQMLHAHRGYAFSNAIAHLDDASKSIANYLIKLTPDTAQCAQMLMHSSNSNSRVFLAAKNDRFDVIKYWLEQTANKEERDEMIHEAFFTLTAERGHLDVIKYLLEQTTNEAQRNQMIHARDDWAFISAAQNGHLDVIKYLLEQTTNEAQRNQMIHAHNNWAFILAARNGHLDVIKYFLEQTTNEVQRNQMIHAHNNEAFISATAINRLDILEYLLDLTQNEEQRNQMIHARHDWAFVYAAQNGHLDVMEYLAELTTNETQRNQMIHARDDMAFIYAAQNGHIDVVNYLLEKTPDSQQHNQMFDKLPPLLKHSRELRLLVDVIDSRNNQTTDKRLQKLKQLHNNVMSRFTKNISNKLQNNQDNLSEEELLAQIPSKANKVIFELLRGDSLYEMSNLLEVMNLMQPSRNKGEWDKNLPLGQNFLPHDISYSIIADNLMNEFSFLDTLEKQAVIKEMINLMFIPQTQVAAKQGKQLASNQVNKVA